jgi:hypothetical protein
MKAQVAQCHPDMRKKIPVTEVWGKPNRAAWELLLRHFKPQHIVVLGPQRGQKTQWAVVTGRLSAE